MTKWDFVCLSLSDVLQQYKINGKVKAGLIGDIYFK